MRQEHVRTERRAMLDLPHMAPLKRYAAGLRQRLDMEVPDFDPADGGVEARLLFLKEKPGPMTSAKRPGVQGSGFVSRDNDDFTANSTLRIMEEIGLDRGKTIMWNVMPGWNGQIKYSKSERLNGLAEVRNLLALLPKLEAVVLVGRQAQKAEPIIANSHLGIFKSFHPSRRVSNGYPEKWSSIKEVWAAAARSIDPQS